MTEKFSLQYFKNSIESLLCHLYVDRRVAELAGYDVNELDDFIKNRSKAFYEATKDKDLFEMRDILQDLTILSKQIADEYKEM